MVEASCLLSNSEIDYSKITYNESPYEPGLLANLQIGQPISHAQVITLSRLATRAQSFGNGSPHPYHLDSLLRGSRICNKSPKAKAEPTDEYKALMAQLRREEEARAYERMTKPSPATRTVKQRLPNTSNSKLFSGNQAQIDEGDDTTYADVNRQMALIINILVSVVACSIALWLVAGGWSTPLRLAFSMGGSALVALAEAVVYVGYLRRVDEAKAKGSKQLEIKEIIKTWAIGGQEDLGQGTKTMKPVPRAATTPSPEHLLRKRAVGAG
ncbi:MAG: hypothetical protein Q9174_000563 [Haloplaca sp. 1 TL-2023]